MGRSVAKVIGDDVKVAGGTLQTCTGVESGVEASIHAMSRIFAHDDCQAVILVDADNAFNRLNRKASLTNIERLCPPLYRFLNNTYKEPAKLHLGDGTYIMSEEGATQGDPLAMPMYAISTCNIINSLKENVPAASQVWFADDSAAGGKLEPLMRWWTHLNEVGPRYGYHPKPSKTWLILKDPDLLDRAKELFGQNIKMTTEGKRHIGAALGTDDFKREFVNKKVEKWVEDVHQLAAIAKEEPQAALCGFNTGLAQRWTFVQRTMSGIAALFQPLEDAITNELIPALCGRRLSEMERRMVALPYRFGGLGIRNPVKTADSECDASMRITALLADLIVQQDADLSKLNQERVKEIKAECKAEKESRYVAEEVEIANALDEKGRRLLKCAQEKGASSWLSVLPLKRLGYTVNKQEFRDSVYLRYGWKIPDLPAHCVCGSINSVDHAMICGRGGYVIMRHNALRDTEAKVMSEVCSDVHIEPMLLPTTQEQVRGTAAPQARCDVSARGVWSRYEKTFFDIQVSHPTANSHMQKSLSSLHAENERLKKNKYLDRVRNVERASFTPLIFNTTGGMAPECSRTNRRLAELIAEKRNEAYSNVMSHIRTRLRFALLRVTVIAVRGFRGKKTVPAEDELKDISYNLIPRHNDV